MTLSHFAGIKPHVDLVVVVVVGRLVVVVVVVDELVVVVSTVPGEDPHPTRVAETSMLSKLPPMVVAAPPKLSTPNPIQSRVSGNGLPDGTLEPIPCGESQVTGFPDT